MDKVKVMADANKMMAMHGTNQSKSIATSNSTVSEVKAANTKCCDKCKTSNC